MPSFTTPAAHYMSSPVLTVDSGASAVEAERLMDERDITAVGVSDQRGLVGVLSRTDLLEASSGEQGETFSVPDAPVATLMTPDPVCVPASTPLAEVAKKMLDARIHRVFVVREGELVGVVSARDIMRAVAEAKVATPAQEIATTSVFRVEATDPIALAVERLSLTHRHGLVVTDDGYPVGTFSQLDALLCRARDPRTQIEEVMELRLLVLPHETPLYRAAQQALALGVRRFVLRDGDRITGVVAPFDFCRVLVQAA